MKRSIVAVFLCITALLCLSLLSGCTNAEKKPEQSSDAGQNENEITGIDMKEYSMVYPENANASFKNTVAGVCAAIGDIPSSGSSAGTGKEIILSIAELEGEKDHRWSLNVGENVIEIKGNDFDSLRMGLKKFYNKISSGKLIADVGLSESGQFGDEVRIFENLVTFTLESQTVIEKPDAKNATAVLKYPTLIELCHQSDESKNGILLASGERWLDEHNCPVYRSTDGGATFETVTFVKDTLHNGTRSAFAPCLYELPCAVGDMPAGTVILGSDCINGDWSEVYIVLFRSYDQGETWEAFAEIAGGKRTNGGVWEPNFAVKDDGTLICYYSDETDPAHSQKLVYRSTKDGVNWEKAVDMVALSDRGLRPGMPVVTRMNNGQYVLAYEIVGMAGNPVYCRYSDDPMDFGKVTDYGKLPRSGSSTLAATPWISFLDAGNSNGILMLTGWRMASGKSDTGSDIFVSLDRGKKWTSIPNFYSYKWGSDDDTWGYSVSFLLSRDGKTLYYMANPKDGRIKHAYTLYKITIE